MGMEFRRAALRAVAFVAGFAALVLMLILAQPAAANPVEPPASFAMAA